MPTREERLAWLAKARLAPKKVKERRVSIATEKTDLASPVHLTGPGLRPATGRMERFLKACGLTSKQYTDWTGFKTLPEFMAKNPGWSMRSWEILILENKEAIRCT